MTWRRKAFLTALPVGRLLVAAALAVLRCEQSFDEKTITNDWRKFHDGQTEKKIFGCI